MKINLLHTKLRMAAALFLLIVGHALPAWSQGDESGTCGQFDFSRFYQDGALKWAGVARVTRAETPLYAADSGSDQGGFLLFNQQGEILEEGKERLKVRMYRFKDKPQAEGWVAKNDLLCRNLPIKSESGLEMKFFIKTSTLARTVVEDEKEPTVQVFQDPELKDCVGGQGSCREGASRFHMYFVFDQTPSALLLADRYRLEEDDLLLGWVSKKDGFLWNNAFSLRPREDLPGPDGMGTGTICTYERLEDAVNQNKEACQPVVGGNGWFRSPLRIPVLELVDAKNNHVSPGKVSGQTGKRRFYRVALARPGLVGRRVSEDKVAISPELAQQIMPDYKPVKSISAKKHVDIFFLLDATASMEPVFDAVRGKPGQPGVIQEIIRTLKNTQGFKETQFRFGFRVYRDPYADRLTKNGIGDGVGEGFPLSGQCDMNEAERDHAFETFKKAISDVDVTINDERDDYEENLYGGLRQVLKHDITSCADNLKLLFVIGDNGYKAGRGRNAKYKDPVSQTELVELMRGSGVGNNIISFFIQTPSRADRTKHPRSYEQAYTRFESQTQYLLQKTLPMDAGLSDYFLRMGEDKMLPTIVKTVEKLGSSALINEILLDIRGGAALTAIIDRLRRERVDIPGVYWHILKKGACGELGVQCENRVFDTTRIGYIEADDKVIEELWVSSSGLSSWIRILRGFEGYFDLPEAQLRRALISAMVLGLQQEIRRPPIDVAGETPAEYAQRRGGLPVRRHSPLLSYNVNALSAERVARNKDGRLVVLDRENKPLRDNTNRMIPAAPACELRRLALWAIKSKEMLEIVERDFFRPEFKADRFESRRCPDATANGRALIKVDGPIRRVPLGPDKNYRFAHTFGGRRGYWIPQDYLP